MKDFKRSQKEQKARHTLKMLRTARKELAAMHTPPETKRRKR